MENVIFVEFLLTLNSFNNRQHIINMSDSSIKDLFTFKKGCVWIKIYFAFFSDLKIIFFIFQCSLIKDSKTKEKWKKDKPIALVSIIGGSDKYLPTNTIENQLKSGLNEIMNTISKLETF